MSQPESPRPESQPAGKKPAPPSFGSRPFAELASRAAGLPTQADPLGALRAAASAGAASPLARALSGKIVISRESKGRGGKTVVFARGIVGPPALLESLAKELRHELGTGVRVEDGALLVQGALSERLAASLTRRGAARIVLGN